MASSPPQDFPVTPRQALAIRRIIKTEIVAIEKWGSQVKYSFILLNEAPIIDTLLERRRGHEPNYGGAILNTLLLWITREGEKATFGKLVAKLRKHLLNALADKLESSKLEIWKSETEDLKVGQFDTANFFVDKCRGHISDAVCKSIVALQKWSEVKDDFVKDPLDNIEIDELGLREQVRQTLNKWIMAEEKPATFHKLLTTLELHGLNDVKEALMKKAKDLQVGEVEVPAVVVSCVFLPKQEMKVENSSPDSNFNGDLVDPTCCVCKIENWDHAIKCGHLICEDCVTKIILGPPNEPGYEVCCPKCTKCFKANDVFKLYPEFN